MLCTNKKNIRASVRDNIIILLCSFHKILFTVVKYTAIKRGIIIQYHFLSQRSHFAQCSHTS